MKYKVGDKLIYSGFVEFPYTIIDITWDGAMPAIMIKIEGGTTNTLGMHEDFLDRHFEPAVPILNRRKVKEALGL